jgi:hypothetical protein
MRMSKGERGRVGVGERGVVQANLSDKGKTGRAEKNGRRR